MDDDVVVVVCNVLARMMGHAGHEVVQADGGRAGLLAFERAPADVVVTDINMPDMDGIEVIGTFRELYPEVPIVAISGWGLLPEQMLLPSAHALGADEVVSKPFDMDQIRQTLERASTCKAG